MARNEPKTDWKSSSVPTADDFNYIETKLVSLDGELNGTNTNLTTLEGNLSKTNASVTKLEGNLNKTKEELEGNISKTKDDLTSSIATKEPKITKNTAFNKHFGADEDSVCRGNDSRLSNARPASDVYAWAKNSNPPKATELTGDGLYGQILRSRGSMYKPEWIEEKNLSAGRLLTNLGITQFVVHDINWTPPRDDEGCPISTPFRVHGAVVTAKAKSYSGAGPVLSVELQTNGIRVVVDNDAGDLKGFCAVIWGQ